MDTFLVYLHKVSTKTSRYIIKGNPNNNYRNAKINKNKENSLKKIQNNNVEISVQGNVYKEYLI